MEAEKSGNRKYLVCFVIEPAEIARAVALCGGIQVVVRQDLWERIRELLKLPASTSSSSVLYSAWKDFFPQYSAEVSSSSSSSSSASASVSLTSSGRGTQRVKVNVTPETAKKQKSLDDKTLLVVGEAQSKNNSRKRNRFASQY